MKKNLIRTFATCVCLGLFSLGYAQTSRVSGTLHSYNDSIFYQWFNKSDGSHKDQVKIHAPNGKFSFDLPDKDAVYTVLLFSDTPITSRNSNEVLSQVFSNLITFEVFPGEHAEVFQDERGVGVDSPTYSRYAKIKTTLDGYRAKIKKWDKQGKEDSIEIYQAKIRETISDYIKTHPQESCGALLIEKEVADADAREAYDLLDPSLKNSKVGAYISEIVKRKEEKALNALNSQKARIAEKPQREAADKIYAEAAKKRLEKGDPMPELKFTDINGKEMTLSSLKGKYVYIDVWATWCGPCRGEIPALKKLEQSLEGKEIAFVSISADANRVNWEKMVKEEELKGIQLYAGGAKQAFSKFFYITGIPRFILLDKQGKILNIDMTRPSNPETEKTLRALEGI